MQKFGIAAVLLSLLLLPAVSHAEDPGKPWCVTPAFVSGNIPPNLLLMIDNSASMYDLAYVDKGKKHCSVTTTRSCLSNLDCPGETCTVDREPYYCYDQTYSNSNTYIGYFATNDSTPDHNPIYYTYDSGTDSFSVSAAAFPDGCGTHGGTTRKDTASNTVCVEYDNTSRQLLSFVAKGNYLNWLTASKFDVEKQIFTGGKFVNKVCATTTDKACLTSDDCPLVPGTANHEACNTVTSFLMPESRGCVGQGFVKDAITANFVNYNSPASNNTNTQLGITFAIRGAPNPNGSSLSPGGQTYIELYATPAKTYNYSACQVAVDTITSTSSTNADVKQTVAACLAGATAGYCSNNANVSCFATFPDCYVPGHCSTTTGTACTSSTNCPSGETCLFGYFCEGAKGGVTNISCSTPGVTQSHCTGTTTVCGTGYPACPSGKTCDPDCPASSLLCNETVACTSDSNCATGRTCVSGVCKDPCTSNSTCGANRTCSGGYCTATPPSISCPTVNSTTGCYTAPTYWCDYSTETYNNKACNGLDDYTTCDSSNTKNGKCAGSNAACQGTPADPGHDPKCPGDHVCLGWVSQGDHNCIVHTPEVNHGTCAMTEGATNGVCGGQLDYGECIFGTADLATKSKVSFQQTMQACWAYNRYAATPPVSGGADLGIDDLKTLDKQCSDIYNGVGSATPYMTCSNDHNKECTSANAGTVCGSGNSCTTGPIAIGPGYPALICSNDYVGKLYYQSSGTWYREGSLNDTTTAMSGILLPSGAHVTTPPQCLDTDTLRACLKKIYVSFCAYNTASAVTDPTDSPSTTAKYDNLPAIMSGIAIESQLGAPIKKARARVIVPTPACSAANPCGTDQTCVDSVCKPSGLIQQFGADLRIGAMSFDPFGVGNSTESALNGIRMTRLCSNDSTKICTADADCNTSSTGTNKCLTTYPASAGRVCSNNAATTCTSDSDCGSGNFCRPNSYDGGRILYPVGKGVCYAMGTSACDATHPCSSGDDCINGLCGTSQGTVCTTNANCNSSHICVRVSAGDHAAASSLVQTIDSIRAEAWTPFGEAFYNALGYFAAVPSGTRFIGRTGLRLNSLNTTSTTFTSFDSAPVDFNENLNPSEYRCQQNYILLVTDGSSTADRNSAMTGLASIYATQAQATSGTCTSGTVDYGGSSNLPILSYIGNHHNLANFPTSGTIPTLYCPDKVTACSADGVCTTGVCPGGEDCSASPHTCPSGTCRYTTSRDCASYHCASDISTSCGGNPTVCTGDDVCTRSPRDYVTTYVVFNGAGSGTNDACDAYNLLNKTAQNSGTDLKRATDPAGLKTALTGIFENIAAKASSGTAASILSNSEGSGANILQAVFYPKKVFDSQTFSNWIGEMQNLWYFVDPLISHSTIREDTDHDTSQVLNLDLKLDSVVSLRFNNADNTTYAYVSRDLDGDGTGDTDEVKKNPDLIKSVWRAGKQLWQRNLALRPRTIYTPLLPSGTEVGSTGLMAFGSANATALESYLTTSNTSRLIDYVHGFDFPSDTSLRNRTVMSSTIKTDYVDAGVTYPDSPVGTALYLSRPQETGLGVWKLADIISSTPRIQSNTRLNTYGLPSPGGYSDASYNSFIGSDNYKSRGMVYVGANDGMMHAFNLGILDVTARDYQKAKLTGSDLGEEAWAFIPKQALPYLKYYSSPVYNHIYSVDGSTLLLDASIKEHGGSGSCDKETYDTCSKLPVVVVDPATNNAIDETKNSWMTVLIGGAGLGGATAKTCATTNCVATPQADPVATGSGLGYSSYFALDITTPGTPKLLWEFSSEDLGYATTGPAIVRVGPRDKNGKWFAVFGTGPTGKIDTTAHQFMGYSDKPLKFFAVDLRNGTVVSVDSTWTPIANAFAGSMMGGSIDADRWNPNVTGYYQDDAIYVGYTAKTGTTWADGGVLRIVTNDSSDPRQWRISPVTPIPTGVSAGVGPVTSAIARLQDRKNRALWLYFGTGRYYSRSGNSIDDFSTRRAIYGIKEPCYNYGVNGGNFIDKTCTDTVTTGSIANQTSSIHAVGAGGWKIDLDEAGTSYGAERVVTDAVALTNGTVFLTSFAPTADICGFGGNSYLWALDYRTGDRPSDAALSGKALIQLSTGEFREVELSQAFTDTTKLLRRTTIPMTGKPPADAFPVVSKSANRPVKRILHIQER